MKYFISLPMLVIYAALSGCATTPPQVPVGLANDFWQPSQKKVGIVMTALPKIDVHLPGASCLLCIGVAEAANSSISKHAKTFTNEGLPELKQELAKRMKKSGVDVVVIEETLDISKLQKKKSATPNASKYDFSSFEKKYDISHLLVVDIRLLGIYRTYSAYVPTSDPKGAIKGQSYLINLNKNVYEWYLPIEIFKSANEHWSEPPAFPALTNAYYQALEQGKESILAPFSGQLPVSAQSLTPQNLGSQAKVSTVNHSGTDQQIQ